jgi:hypothetical protein
MDFFRAQLTFRPVREGSVRAQGHDRVGAWMIRPRAWSDLWRAWDDQVRARTVRGRARQVLWRARTQIVRTCHVRIRANGFTLRFSRFTPRLTRFTLRFSLLTSRFSRGRGRSAPEPACLGALMGADGASGAWMRRVRGRDRRVRCLDRLDPVASLPQPHDLRFGALTFSPPETLGQFVAVKIPIGDLASRAMRSVAVAQHRRAERAAHAEVVEALAQLNR